jgi:DNA-binding MurR/RpiR family transcriptional regulator
LTAGAVERIVKKPSGRDGPVVDVEVRLVTAGATRRAATGAPLGTVLRQLVAADIVAMRETAARLDLGAVRAAARAVATARRVDICGPLVGAELHRRLHGTGVSAWYWQDLHAGLSSAANLGPADVAIGVSHSGHDRETVEILAEAGSRGARTVAVTGFPAAPLAGVADVVLLTAAEPATFRPDAMAAHHSQLLVLDLLYLAVEGLRS